MPPDKSSTKLPSLDGWRAVSIALVLLAHSTFTAGFPTAVTPWITWFQLGSLGVQFFFVISGFLITWLLLQEHLKHGAISLKHFYLRRALRILPVYFFYLLVLGCLTRYVQTPVDWVANITFTTNFFWVPEGTAHFWSLGVEEQFYLLWPGLLVLLLHCKKNCDRKTLLKFLVVPLVVVPLIRIIECKHWYPHNPEWLRHLVATGSFFMRSDSLAYGCVAAVLFTYWRPDLETVFEKRFHLIIWSGISLLLLPVALRMAHLPARFQAAGFEPLQSVGLSLLLLQSVLYPSRGFYRVLNFKWVTHLGVLSYSIYIWQQMFCGTGETIFGVKDAWWTSFPVWLATTLLAAHASYYLLEKPLLGLRARFREA